MSYKAFISYSHAADGKLAPALQSALHRFAKPFYRLRAIRVFRDKTSLHLTPELWPLIQAALAKSEYFLLLASPGAAQSQWVQMEVEEWLKLRDGSVDHLLIVQTEGEIGWDGAANDFDWSITNALPANLKGVFKREPFYCDLRWARTSTDVSLRNPQFLDDVGSLAAALHGKSKDEMMGNDIRQHRVFKAVAAVVGVLLLALAVGATVAAVYANRQKLEAERQTIEAERQRNEAQRQTRIAEDAAKAEKLAREEEERQKKEAERAAKAEQIARGVAEERRIQAERESRIASSRELASSASAQLAVDPERSILLSVEAHARTHTAQSEEALRRSLLASRVRHTIEHVSWVKGAEFSRDGRWLSVDRGSSHVLEVGTWNEAAAFRDRDAFVSAAFRGDGKTLLTQHAPFTSSNEEHILRVIETGSWRPTGEWRRNARYGETVVVSPDGRLLLQWSYTTAAMSLLDDPRTVLWTTDAFHARQAVFSPDGKYVAVAGRQDDADVARVLDATTGRQVHDLGKGVWSNAPMVFSADGKYLAVAYASGVARVFETATGKAVAELEGAHRHGRRDGLQSEREVVRYRERRSHGARLGCCHVEARRRVERPCRRRSHGDVQRRRNDAGDDEQRRQRAGLGHRILEPDRRPQRAHTAAPRRGGQSRRHVRRHAQSGLVAAGVGSERRAGRRGHRGIAGDRLRRVLPDAVQSGGEAGRGPQHRNENGGCVRHQDVAQDRRAGDVRRARLRSGRPVALHHRGPRHHRPLGYRLMGQDGRTERPRRRTPGDPRHRLQSRPQVDRHRRRIRQDGARVGYADRGHRGRSQSPGASHAGCVQSRRQMDRHVELRPDHPRHGDRVVEAGGDAARARPHARRRDVQPRREPPAHRRRRGAPLGNRLMEARDLAAGRRCDLQSGGETHRHDRPPGAGFVGREDGTTDRPVRRRNLVRSVQPGRRAGGHHRRNRGAGPRRRDRQAHRRHRRRSAGQCSPRRPATVDRRRLQSRRQVAPVHLQ